MTVETTTVIGGQKIGLLFGLPSIQYWNEYQNGPLSAGKEITIDQTGMAHVLYGGYLNYCKAEAIEPELKFRSFFDFVEAEAYAGSLIETSRICKLFFQSISVTAEKLTKRTEEIETEGKEKKNQNHSTGTKLRRSA